MEVACLTDVYEQVRWCPDASCRQAHVVREYHIEVRHFWLGEETGLL